MKRSSMLLLALAALSPAAAQSQLSSSAAWAAYAPNQYQITPDITYLTAEGYESRLDLYVPRNATAATPVLMYFHGGFWVRGSKDASVLNILPYLEMGWAVVNVGYRLGRTSLAPGAVEDARCALRWVVRNAQQYRFDTTRIVTTGHSAGGHLSLMTGMLTPEAGLDDRCPGNEALSVAAIVDWYGPTDLGDQLEGPNRQNAVVEWFGGMPDRFEVAERVSPLTYVRRDLPPILTIHGDADVTVPYSHAVRLHAALEAAGAKHELHTVPGGAHGGFTREQTVEIFNTIQRFLTDNGILDHH
ncbi:MAG: alpha/beta hydrolase [Longimicrobiales bacterium]